MQDISGFGILTQIRASLSAPSGFTVTTVADDTDPFDVDPIDMGDAVTGVNGDLICWSKTAPLSVKLAVVAESDDDDQLQTVFEANRAAKGKLNIRDVITVVGIFPSGKTVAYTNGKCINFMPGNSVSSEGRLKTKVYSFKFENRTVTP